MRAPSQGLFFPPDVHGTATGKAHISPVAIYVHNCFSVRRVDGHHFLIPGVAYSIGHQLRSVCHVPAAVSSVCLIHQRDGVAWVFQRSAV